MEGQGGLIDQYNLDLSSYPALHYMGPLRGEVVVKDGSLVYGSNEFKNSVGEIWPGPIHQLPAQPYQSGARSGYLHSEALFMNEIDGTKTEELMSLDGILFSESLPIEEEQSFGSEQNQDILELPQVLLQNYLSDELNMHTIGPHGPPP